MSDPIDPEIREFEKRVWRVSGLGDKLYVHGGGGFEYRLDDTLSIQCLVGVGGDIRRFGTYSWSMTSASDDEGVFFSIKKTNQKIEVEVYDPVKVRKYTPLFYRFAVLQELADV